MYRYFSEKPAPSRTIEIPDTQGNLEELLKSLEDYNEKNEQKLTVFIPEDGKNHLKNFIKEIEGIDTSDNISLLLAALEKSIASNNPYAAFTKMKNLKDFLQNIRICLPANCLLLINIHVSCAVNALPPKGESSTVYHPFLLLTLVKNTLEHQEKQTRSTLSNIDDIKKLSESSSIYKEVTTYCSNQSLNTTTVKRNVEDLLNQLMIYNTPASNEAINSTQHSNNENRSWLSSFFCCFGCDKEQPRGSEANQPLINKSSL